MAKFKGSVTQAGWSVEFEASEDAESKGCLIVQTVALLFLEGQTIRQKEEQALIRQAIQTDETQNGHSEEGPPEPTEKDFEEARDWNPKRQNESEEAWQARTEKYAQDSASVRHRGKRNLETLDTKEAEDIHDGGVYGFETVP